jgi:hypothetical protein
MRLNDNIGDQRLKLFAVSDCRNCGENCDRSTNINSIADSKKVMKYRSLRGPARPLALRVLGRSSQGSTTAGTLEVKALCRNWPRIL